MDRYDYMKEALTLAKKAAEEGEVPVGCVIVKDGSIIACGRNRTLENNCAINHAEIDAIKNASEHLGCENLSECDLYVTLEPCPMCAGAIINSKIRKVVFGAFDLNYGACGSVIDLFQTPNIHRPECYGGIMEDECSDLLTEFFKKIRTSK
ncbi:MAG: nucleoside deaminase [Ruminococcus sp.]|nr:nucleoside deaminase [Ruminococcus sp.]